MRRGRGIALPSCCVYDTGDAVHGLVPGMRARCTCGQAWSFDMTQMSLALAWIVGGRVGDAMTRRIAHLLGSRVDPQLISAQMCYPCERSSGFVSSVTPLLCVT